MNAAFQGFAAKSLPVPQLFTFEPAQEHLSVIRVGYSSNCSSIRDEQVGIAC